MNDHCKFRVRGGSEHALSDCGKPCRGRYCDEHFEAQERVHQKRIDLLTTELNTEKKRLAILRDERRKGPSS